MRWLKVSDCAIVSDCGRWKVCKVTVGGVDQYELWRQVKGEWKREGDWPTAEQAKQTALVPVQTRRAGERR